MTEKVNSVLIDPELIYELRTLARLCQSEQRKADSYKWQLARKANDEWPEYEFMTVEGERAFPIKKDYYKEITRVINLELPIALFGESGETLRRYCELEATCHNIKGIDELLKATSLDHAYRAKRLAAENKIKTENKTPANIDYALAKAIAEKWSAEDMENYFDPKEPPHPYDVVSNAIAIMLDRSNYEWIKSADVRDAILSRVGEIEKLIQDELRKEGKAQ